MTFLVTAAHIEAAKERARSTFIHHSHHNYDNPIAVALQDRCPHAMVTGSSAHLCCGGFVGVVPLPYYAQTWLTEFLRHRPVQPFEMTL